MLTEPVTTRIVSTTAVLQTDIFPCLVSCYCGLLHLSSYFSFVFVLKMMLLISSCITILSLLYVRPSHARAFPPSLARQKEKCANLSHDFGDVSLLSMIKKSTSSNSMYSNNPRIQKAEFSSGSGHRIFYRLIMASKFRYVLNDTSLAATLFIPNDLSARTSAQDLMDVVDSKRRIKTFTEARQFLIQEFPCMFKNPATVLDNIVANHLISDKLNYCMLFRDYNWTSWANETIFRSGIRLISPNHTAVAPELDISKIPNLAGDSIAYAVDRVLFPNLAKFPRLSKYRSLTMHSIMRKQSRWSRRQLRYAL